MTFRPQTMIQKILSRHARESPGRPRDPDEYVEVDVDRVVLLDMAATHPEFMTHVPKKVQHPERILWVLDHYAPPPTADLATGIGRLRGIARAWGVTHFYDAGRSGISHPFAAENGWVRPGEILANTDSHTVAAGALGCAGRGVGMLEIMSILCTGATWYRVGETIQAELDGTMPAGVMGKDLFLSLARDHGSIPNRNLEFTGGAVPQLSVTTRQMITTMCAEIGAEFALFPPDAVALEWLRSRIPPEARFDPVYPDPGADYADRWAVRVDELEPLVALPGKVARNVKPAAELEGMSITRAVVGSCANGTLEDFRAVADILRGRRVADGVLMTVTPNTPRVLQEAARLGYVDVIVAAGATVTNSTCGACFGGHMGVLGDDDVCVTSTTRNFQGRMGSPKAKIYLASSATVAASAVEGALVDPRPYLAAPAAIP